MKIMFMGTPDIATKTLEGLLLDGHNVVCVISAEDKPRGRGNVMTPTPVKLFSTEKGIPTYTPKTLKDAEFAAILDEYTPDLIIVVAYGKILPKSVIDYPKFGCINLHVSLLPEYRGAAPIQRAIMDGKSVTGVTVMHMDEGLDTGDIIDVAYIPITDADNAETIHDKSAEVGARLLSKTVSALEAGTAKRTPQDNTLATYAKKIEKEDCKIDFNLDAVGINCRIRGVTPIPGAFCFHNGKMLKIVDTTPMEKTYNATPGCVVEVSGVGDGYVTVACAKGSLKITKVKPEGKGVMTAGDFVRGRKIAEEDILT